MSTFGERVRDARRERMLSQQELAEIVGTSQSLIAGIERGQYSQSRRVFELAQALGVDPAWLANGSGEDPIAGLATERTDAGRQRAKRLRQLCDEFASGSVAKLSRMAGLNSARLTDYLNGRRLLSERLARDIEAQVGVPAGWLDALIEVSTDDSQPTVKTNPTLVGRDSVTIEHFDTGGIMGHGGFDLPEQPGVIQSWRVSREWLQKNIPAYTSVDNLCLVTGFGDSMRPMFNSGDPLVVDRGVRSIKFDGVYFFRVDGEGFIKRLQRIPTEDGMVFRAKSENTAYEAWDITKKMDFEVFGRVLKVWRSEEF